jgi:hypothetical protein
MRKVNKTANFYLALIISVVFVIALILAISSGNSVKNMAKGSPEAAVQQYLKAVIEGRNQEAADFFSSNNKCTIYDIDRAYIEQDAQVSLDKTVKSDDKSAIVYVSIQRSGGLLLEDPYTESQTFRMIFENSEWKIDGIPWPLYNCDGEPK